MRFSSKGKWRLDFEIMNKTKIEWTDYTWNPQVGCKNGCWYCYAKRMNDRFKWIKKWNRPKFFVDRLHEPGRLKKPSKIFVGSMTDIFGVWVPSAAIYTILSEVSATCWHTYQFLTRNPKRYSEFAFPTNCWLGVTIDGTEKNAQQKISDLKKMKHFFKFISFEPLLGDVSKLNLKGINLVIVGAMTGPGAVNPKREWIKSIKHPNIFYKENIRKFL